MITLILKNIFPLQQLSQFWYDETTINTLVQIALKTVGSLGKIALISCPSLFTKIRQQAEADCESIFHLLVFKLD